MKKRIGIVLALLIGSAVFADQVSAGGWVVASVEELPQQVRAGEDVQLAFWIRQHGVRPTHDVDPFITGRNLETGEEMRITADKGVEVGLFEATLNFPNPGEWAWSISIESFSQSFEQAPLTVTKAVSLTSGSESQRLAAIVPAFLRVSGLLLIGLAFSIVLFEFSQKRKESAVAPGD